MAVIFGIVFGLDIVIGVLYLVQIDLALTNIHNYWRCIWSDLSLICKDQSTLFKSYVPWPTLMDKPVDFS